MQVVISVVAVIGTRLEDRVHVDGVDADRLQVIELVQHAFQIATVELVAVLPEAAAIGIARIADLGVPLVVGEGLLAAVIERASGVRARPAVVVRQVAVAEAVGHDVVDGRVLQPGRCLKVRVVDRELERGEGLAVIGFAQPVLVDVVVVVEVIVAIEADGRAVKGLELVVVDGGGGRHRQANLPHVVGLAVLSNVLVKGHRCVDRAGGLSAGGVEQVGTNEYAVEIEMSAAEAKSDLRVFRGGSAWRPIERIEGVVLEGSLLVAGEAGRLLVRKRRRTRAVARVGDVVVLRVGSTGADELPGIVVGHLPVNVAAARSEIAEEDEVRGESAALVDGAPGDRDLAHIAGAAGVLPVVGG